MITCQVCIVVFVYDHLPMHVAASRSSNPEAPQDTAHRSELLPSINNGKQQPFALQRECPPGVAMHSSLPVSAQEALRQASRQYRQALAAIQTTTLSAAQHPSHSSTPLLRLQDLPLNTAAAPMGLYAGSAEHSQQQQQHAESGDLPMGVPYQVQQWLATRQDTAAVQPAAEMQVLSPLAHAVPATALSRGAHADSALREEVAELKVELRAVQARFAGAQVQQSFVCTPAAELHWVQPGLELIAHPCNAQ